MAAVPVREPQSGAEPVPELAATRPEEAEAEGDAEAGPSDKADGPSLPASQPLDAASRRSEVYSKLACSFRESLSLS